MLETMRPVLPYVRPAYDDVSIDPIFDMNDHAQQAVARYEEARAGELARYEAALAAQEEADGKANPR